MPSAVEHPHPTQTHLTDDHLIAGDYQNTNEDACSESDGIKCWEGARSVQVPPQVSTTFIHPTASSASLADRWTSRANQAGEKDLAALSEVEEYVGKFFRQLCVTQPP
jgi:hypothetical protein